MPLQELQVQPKLGLVQRQPELLVPELPEQGPKGLLQEQLEPPPQELLLVPELQELQPLLLGQVLPLPRLPAEGKHRVASWLLAVQWLMIPT